MLPIVRLLPAVVELIGALRVTAKLVVLPTMVRDPLARAVLITDTFTVDVAVTVRVLPLSDQPEPELEAEEIVNVCPDTVAVETTIASINVNCRLMDKNRLLIFICMFSVDRN
jgi:hypothetical protein